MNPFIWNNILSHEILEEDKHSKQNLYFWNCPANILQMWDFTFTFIRPVKVNIVYWDIDLWQAGRRKFFCFTDIYHQTTIIKFQCQMRRGEYVNYITNRGVHTGQSNSVARSHILNLSMNESLFTDRDTETTYMYVICMSWLFYVDPQILLSSVS